MNGTAPTKTSGRNRKIPARTLPAIISGTLGTRSASQPNTGSPTSRAAGHAATTTPKVARSTPCAVKYSGMTGSSAPKPSQTISSAARRGRIADQRRVHAAIRATGSPATVGIEPRS
jgi:hypothetical protein